MKIIFICLSLLFCTGCTHYEAKDAVVDYLEKFRNHDAAVMKDAKDLIKMEDLLEKEQQVYDLILKKQYTDLTYKITNQYFNGEKAKIEVELEVYNYVHSKNLAKKERQNKQMTNEEYIALQLDYMKKETSRVKYTVMFCVNLQDDKWVLENPHYTILKKIHGLWEEED